MVFTAVGVYNGVVGVGGGVGGGEDVEAKLPPLWWDREMLFSTRPDKTRKSISICGGTQ